MLPWGIWFQVHKLGYSKSTEFAIYFFKSIGLNVNKIWMYMLKVQQTVTTAMAFTHTQCVMDIKFIAFVNFFSKKKIFVLCISHLTQLTCLTINHVINNIIHLGIYIRGYILRYIFERVYMAITINDFFKSYLAYVTNHEGGMLFFTHDLRNQCFSPIVNWTVFLELNHLILKQISFIKISSSMFLLCSLLKTFVFNGKS